MSKYLIKFTPAEPYFFGKEKTLAYKIKEPQSEVDANKETPLRIAQSLYFARSEDTPSQSTILGALRLLLLLDNGRSSTDFSEFSDCENALVGEHSFKPDMEHAMGTSPFGCIKSVSPVFIMNKADEMFIPVPLDHNTKNGCGEYAPFEIFEKMETLDGKKLFSYEYNPKDEPVSGFVSLSDGKIWANLIEPNTQIGINRRKGNDGFFKREMKMLKKDHSFAVICELACKADKDGVLHNEENRNITEYDWNNSAPLKRTAYLGQGRSAFAVEIKKYNEPDLGIKTAEFLTERHEARSCAKCYEQFAFVYCLGDAFMKPNKYKSVLFAVTHTRDYRALTTKLSGKTQDGPTGIYMKKDSHDMYHMLKAGSVLMFENEEKANEWIVAMGNEAAETIGFNTFVTVPTCVSNDALTQ